MIIEAIPGKRSGQPCIKGTRISVKDVLNMLEHGMTVEEVMDDHYLTRDQVQACINYKE